MKPDGWIGAPSHVYITASRRNGTIYTGVTSDILDRIGQHRKGVHPNSFTARYGCKRLVWHEVCENIVMAIAREKVVKKYGRKRKLALIEEMNPDWTDVYDDLLR